MLKTAQPPRLKGSKFYYNCFNNSQREELSLNESPKSDKMEIAKRKNQITIKSQKQIPKNQTNKKRFGFASSLNKDN